MFWRTEHGSIVPYFNLFGDHRMLYKKTLIATALACAQLTVCSSVVLAKGSSTKEITLIHMGDLHGHTIPRPNLRSDGDGRMEGGIARIATKIKQIRSAHPNSLLFNTGDTTQGSGEALYSRGKALVDVVDMLGVNFYAPGNWDYVYGPARFREFFVNAGNPSKRRWHGLASNLYETDPNAPSVTEADGHTSLASYNAWSQYYADHGKRLLPPYEIKTVGNVKVGVIGCTTSRGPQVVGEWVTDGIEFTDCAKEVPKYVQEVRAKGVDVVVLISEIEIGRNIQIARAVPGIDIILNSDMHEETQRPIEVQSPDRTTLIIEEGQDGTMLGEIQLKLGNGAITQWNWTPHRIHNGIREDDAVARKIKQVRAPYTTAFKPDTIVNPFNGTYLKGSLDKVVGDTLVGLHRSGYSDDAMPAVVEGTSHDFIADAIRWWAHSDLATVRGFRYGTHVRPGPITRNDLFHFVPIGPRVGKASRIHAGQLRNQVDNSSLTIFSSDPGNPVINNAPGGNEGWAGGWMFAYSGPTLKFDPYYVRIPGQNQSRSRAIMVTMACDRLPPLEVAACVASGNGSAVTQVNNDQPSVNPDGTKNETAGGWTPSWAATVTATPVFDLTPTGWTYAAASATKVNLLPKLSVAGYWYAQSPDTINNCNNCFPRGTSNDVNSPDAPYLLPVNVGADGQPSLDANGNPILLRDANGDVVRDAQNRPQVAGSPIDMTEIIEKYLAATGSANPTGPRITLVNPLPGRAATNGVPFMQPLCGTIGKNPADPYICP